METCNKKGRSEFSDLVRVTGSVFPNKRKFRCSKLKVGNGLVTNKEGLLGRWADHFTVLSTSIMTSRACAQR